MDILYSAVLERHNHSFENIIAIIFTIICMTVPVMRHALVRDAFNMGLHSSLFIQSKTFHVPE